MYAVDGAAPTFAPSRWTVYEAAAGTAFQLRAAVVSVVPVTVSPVGAGRAPVSWPPPSSPQKRAVW